jgi:hypothetical protein
VSLGYLSLIVADVSKDLILVSILVDLPNSDLRKVFRFILATFLCATRLSVMELHQRSEVIFRHPQDKLHNISITIELHLCWVQRKPIRQLKR